MKHIVYEKCIECPFHTNDHYCEIDNCKSITKEECDDFPSWCPLEDA